MKARHKAFVVIGLSISVLALVFTNAGEYGSKPGRITPEVGGSNYAFIELGRYAQNPTPEYWASDVKTPLVHYHLMPGKVQEQLDFFIENGQQKIAIMVWYVESGLNCEFHLHTVCPLNGKLPPQAKSNLQNLLVEISRRPFQEVQIRLGLQGLADIHGWTQWEEQIYQSNRDFTMDVIATSEETLRRQPIKRIYDLGAELMGHPHIERPWYQQYLRQIWKTYLQQYSPESTIGFSFNHAHRESVLTSLDIFDESGVRPARLGFDIYLDRLATYSNIAEGLEKKGWRSFPIYIQETYRNDAQIAQEILEARKVLGLNIRTIAQWPLDQGFGNHSNSTNYNFDNYR